MFNFKFLNKMTKNRFNLRKVATIVACLAVTTMFASCDGKNGDDDGNDGGKIDPQLVGTWMYHTTSVTHHLHFLKDGTYTYNLQIGVGVRKFAGKYSTAKGRVYFSETKNTENGTIIQPYNLEYLFGNNQKHVANDNPSGEYLKMYWLPTGAFGTEGNPSSAEEFMQQSYPMNEYRRTGK